MWQKFGISGEIIGESRIFVAKIGRMMKNEVPKFLLKLDFMIKSVAFIAAFSILFMLIYTPFSMTAWFDVTDGRHLAMTVGFYLVAIAVMIISKIGMRWVQNHITVTSTVYLLWLLGETVVISLLYTGFTQILIFHGEYSVRIAVRAFCCVTAILAIPYTIASLYAAYKAKKEENDLMHYRANILNGDINASNLINLSDGNGVIKLTVDSDSLYYMESQDNYVKICYENDGSLHNYMLRCRTKTLEENLANTPMVRCHRSYIINTTKIKLLKSEKANNVVILKHPDIKPIPVSKSYYSKLMELISDRPAGQ